MLKYIVEKTTNVSRERGIMAAQTLGRRLRELRKKAGMSQREVANGVKINFTYLSKIESGVMYPREDVLIRLAKVLGTDKDELITLAGRVPSDLAPKLKNREIVQYLRSYNSEKIIRLLREKGKD